MEDPEILKQFGYSSSVKFAEDFMEPDNFNIRMHPNLKIRKSEQLQTNGLFFKYDATKDKSYSKYFDQEETLLELIRIPSENLLNIFTLKKVFKLQEEYDERHSTLLEKLTKKIKEENESAFPILKCKDIFNTFMSMFSFKDDEENTSLFEVSENSILLMCLNSLFFWNSYKAELSQKFQKQDGDLAQYFEKCPVEKFSPYVKLLKNSNLSNNFLKNCTNYEKYLDGTTLSFQIPIISKEYEKYDSIVSAFCEKFGKCEPLLKSKFFTLQTYLDVLTIFESRSLELPKFDPDSKNDLLYSTNTTLLPLIDFANHDLSKLNSHFDTDPKNGDAVLVLNLPSIEGEVQDKNTFFEIFIRYTDDETYVMPFMCQYAFVPINSSWKTYPFQIEVYNDDVNTNIGEFFNVINLLFSGDCTILQISVTDDQEYTKSSTIEVIDSLYHSLPKPVQLKVNKSYKEDNEIEESQYLEILKQYILQYCIPRKSALMKQKLTILEAQPKEERNDFMNMFVNFELKMLRNFESFVSDPESLVEDIFGYYD